MDLMHHPDRAERIAASYALGTLRGRARRRFEAQARQSPALRALALVWQERFAAMTELQPEETPSPDVWKRIALELGRERALAHAAPSAPRRPWFAGRAPRVLLQAAAVVLVFALAWLFGLQLREPAPAQYLSLLEDARSVPQLLVTFDAGEGTLTVKRVGAFREAADRSLELWALPPAGAPRSLGVLDHAGTVRLPAGAESLRDVPALAVSLEPRGGAPRGSGPTGPVLFKGAWVRTT